jgi:protein involved in polysaccharide export with SLBB domain
VAWPLPSEPPRCEVLYVLDSRSSAMSHIRRYLFPMTKLMFFPRPIFRRLLIALLMCAGAAVLAPSRLSGQDPVPASQAQQELIRAELAKRGLTEQEARARLAQEGIVIESIPIAELPSYQGRIVAILDKLAAEKKAAVATASNVVTIPSAPPSAVPPMASGKALPTTSTASGSAAASPMSTVAEAVADAKEKVAAQSSDPSDIYGHSIFTNKTLEVFRTTDGARAPETYILGSGDQVHVSIFGTSQADLLLQVGDDGYAQVVGVPRIFLQGLTLAQARVLLQARLSSYYTFNANQIAITIQVSRTITVNIFGESKLKGSFSVSALNTAFNALSAAGGLTKIGSVRDIQVIRGTTRRRMDVYAFMDDPSMLFRFDLQHNDVIFVPLARTVVTLEGAVKRPMRYELLAGEDLRDLIRFAGGVNYDTYPDFVQVERVQGDSVVLKEWRLSEVLSGKTTVSLGDGDVVRIRTIGRALEQFVDVRGAVFYEGKYDLGRNPTLKDVLARAQLRPQAKTDIVFIERLQPDSSVRILPIPWGDSAATARRVALEPRDRVVIFDRQRYADVAKLEVQGDVRIPTSRRLAFGERLQLKDVLTLAGGLKPTAADIAYVFRTDLYNPSKVEYLRVDVRRDLTFPLGAGDSLVIYDRRTYSSVGQLALSGAVHNPVRIEFDPVIRFSDLMTMAGGFTRGAALNRVDVFRLNVSAKEGTTFDRIQVQVDSQYRVVVAPPGFRLQPFDQVVVREIPLFDVARSVQLSGQVLYPGSYALTNQKVYLSDVILQAGGFTELADPVFATLVRAGATGTVGIDLKAAMLHKRDPVVDPILVEGDVITIPRRMNTVAIRLRATRVGELNSIGVATTNQSEGTIASFVDQGRHSAEWYINEFAGGFAQKADRWSVTVTDPNGRVRGTTSRMIFFKNYPTVLPGSTVSLRYKFETPPEQKKETFDWDKVSARSMQFITALLSLVILKKTL